MEELDLKQLFNMFWNRKIQMAIIVVIFAVIGYVYTIGFTRPMYSASTTLVLASQQKSEDENGTITSTDVTLNAKLVSTYSELIKSKNVLRQVMSNLDIDINENALRKNITVSSVKDTQLIEITVLNESPIVAANIANEIAKVFSEKIKDIYNIDNVQVVDVAEASSSPSNINHRRDVLIFAIIGVVVSVIYVLVINMFDTTVNSRDDIEREFKLPVLASIPTCNLDIVKKKRGKRYEK